MSYLLDNNRLEILAAADESQRYRGDLVAELASKLLAARAEIELLLEIARSKSLPTPIEGEQ